MSGTVRVRRDVWKLPAGDTTLEWYGKAIGAMKQRQLNDPTSWRYQAAIHDYFRASDPLATPGDVLPTANEQRLYWSQCQHGSWYFLPWHRMYLHYFEKIVASVIASLNGPADWALPYWNYSDTTNANARRIPPAFRSPQLPGGGMNHLFVANRSAASNSGGIVASPPFVALAAALNDSTFSGQSTGGNPGFGGPQTNLSHSGGVIGRLEQTPHGSMHVAVGGPGGWMSGFNTAGLDPLFWLHHANIDRLWVVWRKRNAQHLNPTQAAWRNRTFRFHDATGAAVTLTPGQVVDTTVAPLRYRYEVESDPLAAAPGPVFGAAAAGTRGATMPRRVNPEMVGATQRPIELTGQAETARMAVRAPSGPGFAAARSAGTPQQVYLNIENITGEGEPTSYAVYLNVPNGDDPEQHPELFAGILPMFGVAEASRPARGHSGSGLQYSLEVGDVVRTLQDADAWDPQDIRITFVPALPGEAADEEGTPFAASARRAAASPIQVGRVSLYYA